MMDLSQLNSIAISNNSAAGAVASSLGPRRAAVNATPNDTSTPTSSSSQSDSSDITSQDFLTLLVSELQNQDPTQPTDPNEYITQLAQVNSLQQLISINQGIGTLDGAVGAPASGSGSGSTPSAIAASGVANAAPVLPLSPAQNSIWGGSAAS